MTELLTAKQVQELLSIDRTTIYRMLKDGRLNGIKVGSQWRFRADEIDDLVSLPITSVDEPFSPLEELPLHCVQSIQNIFAQTVNVGTVTIDQQGQLLTKISNCSSFCSQILSNQEGHQACLASRQAIMSKVDDNMEFAQCHAGLQCMGTYIKVKDGLQVAILAGQFYLDTPDKEEQTARINHLASLYKLDQANLTKSVEKIPILNERKKSHMSIWLRELANTFTELCRERADMLNRLRVISEMSDLDKLVSIN